MGSHRHVNRRPDFMVMVQKMAHQGKRLGYFQGIEASPLAIEYLKIGNICLVPNVDFMIVKVG